MPHFGHFYFKYSDYLFMVCFVSVLCSHVASDMAKSKGELLSKELELQRLKKDIINKSSQISCMEESLHRIQTQLDSKTNLGG